MRYTNIDALDARIEKIISQVVKHYYSDWKKYDRPKYMAFKGSSDRKDKEFILIARECGTYIVRTADVYGGNDWATTIYEYYQKQERGSYYYVNIDRLECKKIDAAEYGKELKKRNRAA